MLNGILSFGVPTRFGEFLSMKFVSMSNQSCQPRAKIVRINSNKPLYYPFIVSVNKCGRLVYAFQIN